MDWGVGDFRLAGRKRRRPGANVVGERFNEGQLAYGVLGEGGGGVTTEIDT